ncbi:rhomboid-related protein 2-like isoform X1 [Zootermopsis nevadensis]|uniref:Rhomboid-related protein 3 n=1 Tax=Zootermopsis nevadensis TaxID=136037 RepID=A0A067RFA3_ZOONE|nr:rhomboid-related protein 2-like isoform X1 [Zootermopsis nevadensis]XP_021913661.1 rhomboid-related protein 2-like isoform X1 [Zootermopsis nevadensis]XP_021913662.1 rhomboid-related protein 2-like isoform X1 [Zootermopsis nevadensis]XP_021913663.1 rhomboid-related protein 2-like isoform X1 [Zootermopsis nevadensis]KDR22447.1 Rhomboid-related protein 3 [Zootermopsis nevadensis]
MAPTQREHAVPQTNIALYPHWQLIFDKYDEDSDGKISLSELKQMILSESFTKDIPEHTVRQIMKRADEDANGYIDYLEFMKMIKHKEVQSVMGRALNRYVRATVVQRAVGIDEFDGTGDYENEYSCYPPVVCMILISLLEVIAFLWDVIAEGTSSVNGPAATLFVYNPFKRYEAWRYSTYMFVHVGVFHLVVNLVVQILLGIPLEMVHGWWRVLLVYLAGVMAGSLGTSVSDPGVYLAGASGGVYALIAAHIASICLNWAEMTFAIYQLLIFFVLIVVDVGTAVYTRYVLLEESQIGYAAHLAGAVAGLLVGINVLRNLEIKSWERKVWWASIILYTALMLAAIIWNAAFPSYFPPSK